MSSRRTLILIGSIAMGAIAAFMILNYVSSKEEEAKSSAQRVQVVVVAGAIEPGTRADEAIADGRLTMAERPQVDLPANAVYQMADIKSRIAAIGLAPGEVVTSNKFVNSNESTNSRSNVLEKGQVAVTVSIDEIRAVAGLVQPGDYVNMTNTVNGRVELLYQKVKVLAVGRSFGTAVAAPSGPQVPGGAAPTTTAPPSSNLMTFAVPPDAAQVITGAADTGSLRLQLVRSDYEPGDIPAYDPAFVPSPGARGQTPYPSTADDPAAATAAGK